MQAKPIDLEEQKRRRAEVARRNRELMPNVAAVMDEFRAEFGPGVRLLYGRDLVTGFEVGTTSGKPTPADMQPRKVTQ